MKKIILILFAFIAISVTAQQKGFHDFLDSTYNVTWATDTLLKWPTYFSEQDSPQWAVFVYWTGLTGTLDGTLSIKYTGLPTSLVSDAAYQAYPNMASVTMDSATGYAVFEDTQFLGTRVGLYFDKNNITAGTIKAYIYIK